MEKKGEKEKETRRDKDRNTKRQKPKHYSTIITYKSFNEENDQLLKKKNSHSAKCIHIFKNQRLE